MKKSTILLLVVVYVLSFFVVGLLGHSIRNYDPTIEPEKVEIIDTDNKMEVYRNSGVYDYYFIYRGYTINTEVRLKAVVKPDNTSYRNVAFFKDIESTNFNLYTHESNPEKVEQNFVIVTLTEEPAAVTITRFYVETTNPGTKIRLIIGVAFAI
jgi:hypothetical protein